MSALLSFVLKGYFKYNMLGKFTTTATSKTSIHVLLLIWFIEKMVNRTGQLSQGYHRDWPVTLIPTVNVKSAINLACMSLDCERKLEYLQRTHRGMGRTYKTPPRKAPAGRGLTFSLWSDGATHCTNMQPVFCFLFSSFPHYLQFSKTPQCRNAQI